MVGGNLGHFREDDNPKVFKLYKLIAFCAAAKYFRRMNCFLSETDRQKEITTETVTLKV